VVPSLRKGIARGPEGRDEQLCRAHLAGLGIDHGDCVPCVIDEQPLARRVALTHHRRQLAFLPFVFDAAPVINVPRAEPSVATRWLNNRIVSECL